MIVRSNLPMLVVWTHVRSRTKQGRMLLYYCEEGKDHHRCRCHRLHHPNDDHKHGNDRGVRWQVDAFRTLAVQRSTAMFVHAANTDIAAHYGLTEVTDVRSAVFAIDSRGRKVSGHVLLRGVADEDALQVGWLVGWLVAWLVGWSLGWVGWFVNKSPRVSYTTTDTARKTAFQAEPTNHCGAEVLLLYDAIRCGAGRGGLGPVQDLSLIHI